MLAVCGAVFIISSLLDPEKVGRTVKKTRPADA